MPVHNRRLADRVDEIDLHALTRWQHERRIYVIAAVDAGEIGVAQSLRSAGGKRCGAKRQRAVIERKPAQEAAVARDEERCRLAARFGARRGRRRRMVGARIA